ncbi:MAG: hypothetical protein HC880_09090 [Bacteroidia bacterium]|nr:hypothetical protein [Bacteroidia bacterium]
MKQLLRNNPKLPLIGILLVALGLGVQSCLEQEESPLERQARKDDIQIRTYLHENQITAIPTNAGIYYEILKENPAGKTVGAESLVSIYYKVSLLDGQVVDSLLAGQGSALRFEHSTGSLIPQGLNLGVGLMKQGEQFRFYIPSRYAYGTYTHEDFFPANAILIIEAEVVAVETWQDQQQRDRDTLQAFLTRNELSGETQGFNSGLIYRRILEGSGNKPANGQRVSIHYTRNT